MGESGHSPITCKADLVFPKRGLICGAEYEKVVLAKVGGWDKAIFT